MVFYVILYLFLGYYYGYDNLWLIIPLPLLLISDIWGLKWWINHNDDKYENREE